MTSKRSSTSMPTSSSTRPLDKIIDATREGQICVFEDVRPTRWFAEWEGIFDLRQAPRKQTYINAGFLAVSTRCFPEVLRRWSQCCEHLVGQETHLDTGSFDTPTALSSQDALMNTVLMSDVELDQIDLQPTKSEAQGPQQLNRTRIIDLDRLTCHLDGYPTTLVHSWGSPKPWEPAARKDLGTRRLRRLPAATLGVPQASRCASLLLPCRPGCDPVSGGPCPSGGSRRPADRGGAGSDRCVNWSPGSQATVVDRDRHGEP